MAKANNVELAYVPFYASWLNRIEPQFTALRYFALDGTDHETHRAQCSDLAPRQAGSRHDASSGVAQQPLKPPAVSLTTCHATTHRRNSSTVLRPNQSRRPRARGGPQARQSPHHDRGRPSEPLRS